jgi:hypothetical protein
LKESGGVSQVRISRPARLSATAAIARSYLSLSLAYIPSLVYYIGFAMVGVAYTHVGKTKGHGLDLLKYCYSYLRKIEIKTMCTR